MMKLVPHIERKEVSNRHKQNAWPQNQIKLLAQAPIKILVIVINYKTVDCQLIGRDLAAVKGKQPLTEESAASD